MSSKTTVFVNEFTNGLLDPSAPMLGPVRDGGNIIANTAAGCWGPMITPALRGGHEVTKPVYVEGAEPGDAIAIRIRSIEVTSEATASGVEYTNAGRFDGDPFVADYCPKCGAKWPESYVEGTGNEAIRCKICGAPVSAFGFDNGYTIAFDEAKKMGLTVGQEQATAIGSDAKTYMKTPDGSIQNPVVVMAPAHLPGVAARMKPFLGQLGTTPSQIFPDSHNAGDFGAFLLGAPHPYAKTEADLEARTDGHMDINRVRPGAILICPVKVPGGGIYIGDAHALQGNGEIAGHTCDVSATVTLQVNVIKGLGNEGPILLPNPEDLPHQAIPFSKEEKAIVARLAEKWGIDAVEDSLPISFIGSGANMNAAIDNGLERAAKLLDMSVNEVKNRCTITGSIDIGRAPGVITATLLVPKAKLEKLGLLEYAIEQYGE
ncbi:MAG: acetamidase/formamidase family protein [Lachnospiraceae bacterium]|nr:acetamidase/formamidase family protein [Lachnospiraceae bacterium]